MSYFSLQNIQFLYHTAEHVESAHARVKNLNQHTVLKMCKTIEFSPKRFMDEIKMAKLAYKLGIGPRIYQYGFHQGIGYICMQRMHISLKKLLENDLLTFQHISSFKKIIKIMQRKGDFVHMDLHCENIWFTKDKQAKLIDYDKVNKICRTNVATQQSALKFSTFDIQNLISVLYESSTKKENMQLLMKFLSEEMEDSIVNVS